MILITYVILWMVLIPEVYSHAVSTVNDFRKFPLPHKCGEGIMRNLWELDICTVMLNNLRLSWHSPSCRREWAQLCLTICRLSWHGPSHRRGWEQNAAWLFFLRCLHSESNHHRFLLLQYHAPPPRTMLQLLVCHCV
jgi:hypothetical protein